MRGLLPRLGHITRSGLANCTAAPASPSGNVKVVSYNVLSDSLGRPSHYIHSAKEDCNAKIRLGRVKQQLEVQMQKGAIICLQDVSRKWGAQLVPFFTEHGYTYAAALTGSKFGGYMGQCVEWPTGVYSVQDVDASRISDTVRWGRTPVVEPSLWARLLDVFGLITMPSKPSFNPWAKAQQRHNSAVLVRLVENCSGKQFVVGTYHMPCLFGSDIKCQTMVAHAALLMQHAQRWAGGDPLVVSGDFNIQPNMPMH